MRKPVEFDGWPDELAVAYGPYRAVVARHIDGDTFDALVDLGWNDYRYQPIRVLGVDTPEVNRRESRDAGLAALAFARERLPVGTPVLLFTEPDPDSFGRFLAHVKLVDGTNWSAALVEAGHAVYRNYRIADAR